MLDARSRSSYCSGSIFNNAPKMTYQQKLRKNEIIKNYHERMATKSKKPETTITFANVDEEELPPERIERQRSMLDEMITKTFDNLPDDFSVLDEGEAQFSNVVSDS